MSRKSKNVCVVTEYSGRLDYSPTLYYLIRYMLMDSVNVTLFFNGIVGSFGESLDSRLSIISTLKIRRTLRGMARYVYHMILKKYNSYIFVDEAGLLFNIPALLLKNRKSFFLSLEIDCLHVRISKDSWRKKIIPHLIEKVKLIIIQDRTREKLLRSTYSLSKPHEIFYLPNTYPSVTFKHVTPSPNKEIIYSGTVDTWSIMDDNFFDLMNYLPTEWCLHAHIKFNSGNPANDKFIKKCLSLGAKIKITQDTLSEEKYNGLISESWVGLVWYNLCSKNTNALAVGLSSGKLFQYMRLGRPIITNIDFLSEMPKGCNFIYFIKSNAELPSILYEIENNHEEICKQAKRYFERYFEFGQFYCQLKKFLY